MPLTGLRIPEVSTGRAVLMLGRKDTVALLAYRAACALAGQDVADFDPEAFRMVATETYGATLDEDVLDRVEAVSTLIVNPAAFLDDAHTFESIVLALCGEPVNTNVMQEPEICCLCWGVRHGLELVQHFHPASRELDAYGAFGREVRMYIAALLHLGGYVVCPNSLEFAQAALDMEHYAPSLSARVQSMWDNLDKDNLEDVTYEDTAEGVQLSRLATCYLYDLEQQKKLTEQVLAIL